jgi:hypothetical protein
MCEREVSTPPAVLVVPDSRIFDAVKVGKTLMDVTPGLPLPDNFQYWPAWRPLVIETARCILDYTCGTVSEDQWPPSPWGSLR